MSTLQTNYMFNSRLDPELNFAIKDTITNRCDVAFVRYALSPVLMCFTICYIHVDWAHKLVLLHICICIVE